MSTLIDRLPPQNTEAEECVLGSLLMDPNAIYLVVNFLEPEHFYRERNGAIYAAALELYRRREPIDFTTISDELRRNGRYEEIGGLQYLTHLVTIVPTASHIENYARIVHRCSIKRRIISMAGRLAAAAYDDSQESGEVLAKAQRELNALKMEAAKLIGQPVLPKGVIAV